MWKIVTTEMVAIQDITGITTALEGAALTPKDALKIAVINTMVTPMPIVQEEPVILHLLVAMNVHPLAPLNISAQVL
jgi:hypothetical protein